MTTPFNVGVLQLSMEPAHETIEMAKACEHAGFDAFWIAEAYPWWRKHGFEARSSTAILAVIASQTRRIQLGWGIISPYTRHPVQIAMEARVMQDFLSHGLSCGFAATLFHGISDGTQLIESQARAVEQYVSRPLYVLNFIREIHRRLLTSAFLSFRRIAANAADNH